MRGRGIFVGLLPITVIDIATTLINTIMPIVTGMPIVTASGESGNGNGSGGRFV